MHQAVLHADLIELRLDHFSKRDPASLTNLLSKFSIPTIFTLRSKSQGGNYSGSEGDRLQEIKRLATCRPAYMDLEAHIPQDYFEEFRAKFSEIKLIISHHDFKNTVENLDVIIEAMPKGTFYKVASMAHSTADTLRTMIASKKYQNLISISMGEAGEVSRILAPSIGSITYSCLDEKQASASGQIPVKRLTDIYRYKSIHPNIGIYGLIGNPITESVGHLTHNAVMQAFNLDAVYVKMKVEPEELQTTLHLLKTLGFRGLSVTMPLKEVILPHLDDIDAEAKAIGAVNTVLFDQGRLIGSNTDGIGALECLGAVQGKKIILIGAGGAARAIIFEAIRRDAKVIVLNRTKDKALYLAKKFGCEGASLDFMHKYYKNSDDILINCTAHQLPVEPNFIEGSLVMDITTNPKETLFLKSAQAAGCRIVYGYEMFVGQAVKQFETWFPAKIDKQKIYEILRYTALQSLNSR